MKRRIFAVLLAFGILMMAACTGSSSQEPEAPKEPAVITLEWADEVEGKYTDYLMFNPELGEDTTWIFISTDREVTDFRVLSLELIDVSEDGDLIMKPEPVYIQEKLEPGTPLLVGLTFIGDIPNNGIWYEDADGVLKMWTIFESGYDGSLNLGEFWSADAVG